MAALLVVHGLATPGFLVDRNGVIAFSGAATLPVGGALLALCTVRTLRRAERRQAAARGSRASCCVGVLALGIVGLVVPGDRARASPRPAARRRS